MRNSIAITANLAGLCRLVRRSLLPVVASIGFLILGGPAWAQSGSEGMVLGMPEDHYYIVAKARRVAAAIRSLGVVLPEGQLLDITEELAAIGVRPVAAAPNYPIKFTFPTKIYVSSSPGNCGGVAIAAIVEPRDIHREQNLVYLSIVWNDEKVSFRSGRFTHDAVIKLIAEVQEERRQGGC